MPRHLRTTLLRAILGFTLTGLSSLAAMPLTGCDKKDDPSAAPGASSAPGAGSGEHRGDREHKDWDGGPHEEHPR